MPKYDYYCEDNGKTVEVYHEMSIQLKFWGEICFVSQTPIGETDFFASVRKVISPVGINIPVSNTYLRENGFTKLVKREDGVYENTTALDGEKKFMIAKDKSSIPHFYKKVSN